MKLIRITNVDGDFTHWCPGCEGLHLINTKRKNQNDAQWNFNGDFERPTFTPSVNIEDGACHYNITDGIIIFHDARNHVLGGKSVPLTEMPE